VLLAAVAAFALPAGSAFASISTFVAPSNNATISQNQTFTVNASGVAGATQVYFSIDDGAGNPLQHVGDGVETSVGSGIYTWQAAIGGWDNGALTIDAVVADGGANTLDMASINVTIDNAIDPLTISAVTPADGSTVSGTFTLSVTPSDPNNTVTSGGYSIQGGSTGTLASDGNGHFTASINTIADAIPNGDLYIDVQLEDAPGNRAHNADSLHLVVANPQAPSITPDTLVANKALYRTAETQLEVGDKVQAYGMQADGYPAPVIHYLWNICRGPLGQTCTGITPGQDGLYTIQPADEGATLTLVATATNASGTDFTTVAFGVIGPMYEEPYFTPEPDPAPAVDPAPAPIVILTVVTLPALTPPVVTPPVVTPPLVTPVEQKAINVAKQAVTTEAKALTKAEALSEDASRKAVIAQKQAEGAVNKVADANATATEKKKVITSVAFLVEMRAALAKKVAAAKAAALKASEAREAALKAASAAAKKLADATNADKATLDAAKKKAATTRAAATTKTAVAVAASAKVTTTKDTATAKVDAAKAEVHVAVVAVSAGTATSAQETKVVSKVTESVLAKHEAEAKAKAAKDAAKKLKDAKEALAKTKAAAIKP
jgi:hypothetical protein